MNRTCGCKKDNWHVLCLDCKVRVFLEVVQVRSFKLDDQLVFNVKLVDKEAHQMFAVLSPED